MNLLIRNNKLYANVKVKRTDEEDFNLEPVLVAPESESEDEDALKLPRVSFTSLSNYSYLRASRHQGDRYYQDGGSQCCAIAVTACALASIHQISDWSKEEMDLVLRNGHRVWIDIYEKQKKANRHLRVEDVVGVYSFREYGSVEVSLSDEINSNFQASKTKVMVTECLQKWFKKEPQISEAALKVERYTDYLVVNQCRSSTAIIRNRNELYLFDSHSLNERGYRTSKSGKACLIRASPVEIIKRLLKNGGDLLPNDFTFTALRIDIIKKEDPSASKSKIAIDEKFQQIESDTLIYPTDLTPAIPQEAFNEISVTHHSKNRFYLERKTTGPAYPSQHDYLEEMGFWFLFPTGKFGFSHTRTLKPTIFEYFNFRIMGSDERFWNSEYLFYAVCRIEDNRIDSNINVLSKVKTQSDDTSKNFRLKDINLFMGNIRSYSSYWRGQYQQLMAMVGQLGNPFWFITLSADDLHWKELIEGLMDLKFKGTVCRERKEASQLTMQERMDLIENYPVHVCRYFYNRFNRFYHDILMKTNILGKKVQDVWVRFEFQNRGSVHAHMLVWIENPPQPDSKEGIEYIESQVSCTKTTGNEEFDEKVFRFQNHRHRPRCFRKKEKKAERCLFNFPRKPRKETKIMSQDSLLHDKDTRFLQLKRLEGEEWINYYHKTILDIWEANMDIQPIGMTRAFAVYVCKYVCKGEPEEITKKIRAMIDSAKKNPSLNNRRELRRLCRDVMKNRELGVQEAAVHVCRLPLKICSRGSIRVNSCFPEDRPRMMKKRQFLTGDESDYNTNIFDKYERRPLSVDHLCLAEFASFYRTSSKKIVESRDSEDDDDAIVFADEENHGSDAILNSLPETITLSNKQVMIKRKKEAVIIPPYINEEKDPQKKFYSLLAMFCPFRNESELLEGFKTAEESLLHKEKNGLLRSFSDIENSSLMERYKELQKMIIRINLLRDENEGLNTELEHAPEGDPHTFEDEENHVDLDENIDDIMTIDPIQAASEQQKIVKQLNEGQKEIYEKVKKQIKSENSKKLLIYVSGGAGTGKSFLLRAVKNLIILAEDTAYDLPKIFIAAPTGIAARNVSGMTIHRLFALRNDTGNEVNIAKLDGRLLERHCAMWAQVRWLIIDEISMISYQMLHTIHLRCQDFKRNKDYFGGLNVILMGDLYQLPPVTPAGSAIYRMPRWFTGTNLWHLFEFIELKVNQRQGESNYFVNMLNRLRLGEFNSEDFIVLSQNILRDYPLDQEYHDSLHIFPTNRLVNSHNKKMITKFQKAKKVKLFRIQAKDIYHQMEGPRAGEKADEKHIQSTPEKCGGLPHEILLCVGARVMLRRNLEVSSGLVNGAIGKVTKIIWPLFHRDQLEDGGQPQFIQVQFETSIAGSINNTVDIKPMTVYYTGKGKTHIERTMLPINLCWAVTCHKVQGLTLEKGVVCLTFKLFKPGMAYVALSRFKTLESFRVLPKICERKLSGREASDIRVTLEYERLRKQKLDDVDKEQSIFRQPTIVLPKLTSSGKKILYSYWP